VIRALDVITRQTLRLLTPALSSFEEERENYSVRRFTRDGADFVSLALGYFLSGFQPLRMEFGTDEQDHRPTPSPHPHGAGFWTL